MKNIYLLKTDKKSRLCVTTEPVGEYDPLNPQFNSHKVKWLLYNEPRGSNKRISAINIYITNDEKPIQGDWVYNIVSKTKFKATKQLIDLINDPNVTLTTNKKIIITTDKLLIDDGVEQLTNDFLTWFAKNQDCTDYSDFKNK